MINKIKSPLVRTIGSMGGYYISRYLTRNKPRILMYHRFSADKREGFLDAELFERQIKELVRSFNIVSLTEIEKSITSGRNDKKNMIAITVDDGYQDFYTHAYPILKKYNITATIFVATGFVDREIWLWPDKITYMIENTQEDKVSVDINGVTQSFDMNDENKYGRLWNSLIGYCLSCSDSDKKIFLAHLNAIFNVDVPDDIVDEYKPCTWEQLQEMQSNKIEIGGHTITHPSLSKIDISELQSEVSGCKKRIENKLSKQVEHFCYPNGQLSDYDANVIDAVKSAGYKTATTAFIDNDPYKSCYELRRHAVGENLFQFKKVIYGVELLGRQFKMP